MNPPLISVITPTFNSGAKIAATVASVLSQRKGLYEFLVIDGGSIDDTLAHLRAQGPALRYLSEPDEGIYDAMNKGIRLTSGKFLYFLGAGDQLLPGVLEAVAAEIRKLPGQSQTSRPTLLYGNVDSSRDSQPYDGRFDRFKLLRRNICHQAIFYQRSVFERLGFYNTKYHCWRTGNLTFVALTIEVSANATSLFGLQIMRVVVNLLQHPIQRFMRTFTLSLARDVNFCSHEFSKNRQTWLWSSITPCGAYIRLGRTYRYDGKLRC